MADIAECNVRQEYPCKDIGHRRYQRQKKTAITVACQRFIDEFLKPRFLPVICPTEFNYPIDVLGKWHGTRYRFIQRYRSGFPENLGEEFDSPFVRLDWA